MKYFIARIEERNGDYEYSHIRTIKAVNLAEAVADHEIYTSTFYGNYGKVEDGGYYFDDSGIFVWAEDVKEISEITYNEISDF